MDENTKTVIETAINTMFKEIVMNPTTRMNEDQFKLVCQSLDILRSVIGEKTAYEIKYGRKPRFIVGAYPLP